MARRIRWLGVAVVLCFVVLFLQLNNLQVVKAHQYATAPGNPVVALQKYHQYRGMIVAADGTVLAESVPNPGCPKGSSSCYQYVRVYPTRSLFAQITGYISPLGSSTGVEAYYNSYLVTHNRPVKTLRDLLTTQQIYDTVTLTLQPKLQLAAQQALADDCPTCNGNPHQGAVVVLDPSTGAIEAMYSNPTYDPNYLSSDYTKLEDLGALAYNQKVLPLGVPNGLAITYEDIFPPGSTFKTVTSSTAYDRDPALVNKTFYTPGGAPCIPPGFFGTASQQLCNFDHTAACGGTIAQMLPPSCDTGFALLGADLGAPNMTAEAEGFGFNQQPPIDLPHSFLEVSKFLQPSCYQGAQVFLAYSAIGQDCTLATPLQMAMVAGALANGGVLMTPHVMSEIRDSQGNLVTRYQPTVWHRATSPRTAAALTALMRQVVLGGTAEPVGFPPQDDVAAKTGTAQAGVGNTAQTNDWMIAFAPASHPKVAIAVMIPNQSILPESTGADIAGPVMKAMIEAALALPSS